eukprot:scaffold185442_cov27-Tisochrysis_lutea.AAC.2
MIPNGLQPGRRVMIDTTLSFVTLRTSHHGTDERGRDAWIHWRARRGGRGQVNANIGERVTCYEATFDATIG